MRFLPLFLVLSGLIMSCGSSKQAATIPTTDPFEAATANTVFLKGYFPVYHDTTQARILLLVDKWETEFLYVNSLRTGIGSNDIGLDRGQLGNHRVVKFIKRGPKVFLVQPNYDYRAETDDPAEARATQEAFAVSVLAGFDVISADNGTALIDLTPFLIRDAHGVADRLRGGGQGSYSLDPNRSAIDPYWTRNFPENSEFDAMLTFSGKAEGRYIRSVAPSSDAVTCWQHHSFVKLPDDNYEPRAYDPRAGYMSIRYQDYATPIDQPLIKRYIRRHRLEKREPDAEQSRPLEPIIYYLDPGTPEPVRSALLDGARWWNQAFEAAGYIDAFRVEMLPDYADPLDVRYNVIQWVHRSTRGWSYGSSVYDPRTGEIIKGHVSLGSLRVRQDYLIAQGLLDAYPEEGEVSPGMKQIALARLRQLSAHEVGHTLGLVHNYAASTNDRASVMDYPHPQIELNDNGELVFSTVYDVGIGEWDERAILYGYEDFGDAGEDQEGLQAILRETRSQGLDFLTDADARPFGSASPIAHLWDNGADPVEELHRVMEVRQFGLTNFGEDQIALGTPLAELEEVLVPLYFSHRYQLEAAVKMIGGFSYRHSIRNGQAYQNVPVSGLEQRSALVGLLRALDPEALAIPEAVLSMVPPRPSGYGRPRETMPGRQAFGLDAISAAEAISDQTFRLLLDPARVSRLISQHSLNSETLSLYEVLSTVWDNTWKAHPEDGYHAELLRTVQMRFWMHMLAAAGNERSHPQARAMVHSFLQEKVREMENDPWFATNESWWAQRNYAMFQWERYLNDPADFMPDPAPSLPDGSPIGMGCQEWGHHH